MFFRSPSQLYLVYLSTPPRGLQRMAGQPSLQAAAGDMLKSCPCSLPTHLEALAFIITRSSL